MATYYTIHKRPQYDSSGDDNMGRSLNPQSRNTSHANTELKDENNYNKKGEYIHSFYNLISIIESTEILQNITESTQMYSIIIAEMSILSTFIAIDYKTMVLNISKTGWTSAEGRYGLKNLFVRNNNACYCSSEYSGNCVDLLLDLKYEYTFSVFHAWTTGYNYTCPLIKAYLWVFGTKTAISIDHIKKLCVEKIYSKKAFEELNIYDFDIIDLQTNERKRDELIPVTCVDGSNEASTMGWKLKKKIASYIKGRYVLIKLIAHGNDNVDAKYVGIQGYRM